MTLLHKIFEKQLAFGVFFLNTFGNRRRTANLAGLIATQPPGTLGHAMQQNMIKNGIKMVPGYEKHDMKHALLGYRMEASDEIRMQAFMFGNAGFSTVNSIIFLMFVFYTPEAWGDLYYHYRLGRFVKPVWPLQIEAVASRNLDALREEIGLEDAKTRIAAEVLLTFPG